MPHKKIIPAVQGKALPPATFKSFDKRPVNYYRAMLIDLDAAADQPLDEGAVAAHVQAALAAEQSRLADVHARELQLNYDAGLAKGRNDATAELRRAAELLTEYAQLLQAEKAETATRAEQAALELAFMLAEKIVGGELAAKPERVVDVVRSALQHVLDCKQITLRVHPQDMDYLRQAQPDLEQIVGAGRLEFQQDPETPRGGCMINTERGTIDARLRSQLETLRTTLESATGAEDR